MIYIGLFFISRFWLKSLLYKACHNSGTGEKISMKCGSQTQLDKLKMKMSKNSNNNLAKANYGVILILALFTRYGALWKPDSVIIGSIHKILYWDNYYFLIKLKIELKKLKEPIMIIILRTRNFFSKNW